MIVCLLIILFSSIDFKSLPVMNLIGDGIAFEM
jgi:hypothetical protein